MYSLIKLVFCINVIHSTNVYVNAHGNGSVSGFHLGTSGTSGTSGCGILMPINSSDCPINTFSINNPLFLENCNLVNVGELCEGDGECGTNHFLNNCPCGIFHCDIYIKLSFIADFPTDAPTTYPTDAPTTYPTDAPSTDPCQTYDNSVLCPSGTTYSDCSNAITKAVCPYLCSGCTNISPTLFRSTIFNSTTVSSETLVSVGQAIGSDSDNNKSTIGIITGMSSLIAVALLVALVVLIKKKNQPLDSEPLESEPSNCIVNEEYVSEDLNGTNYMYLPPANINLESTYMSHYELASSNTSYEVTPDQTLYDLGDDGGYIHENAYDNIPN